MGMLCSASLTCLMRTWCDTSKELALHKMDKTDLHLLCFQYTASLRQLSSPIGALPCCLSPICLLFAPMASLWSSPEVVHATWQEAIRLRQANAGCIQWTGMIQHTLWHSQSLAEGKEQFLQPLCTHHMDPCYATACIWR